MGRQLYEALNRKDELIENKNLIFKDLFFNNFQKKNKIKEIPKDKKSISFTIIITLIKH